MRVDTDEEGDQAELRVASESLGVARGGGALRRRRLLRGRAQGGRGSKGKREGKSGGEEKEVHGASGVIPSQGAKQGVAGRAPASCLPACVEKKTRDFVFTDRSSKSFQKLQRDP